MSHIHNLSWKLVSQFISWDFCKYTSEQTETDQSEQDVLTYLRNMIVERTEKAASQVSEHEIIAKFIMEAKTIQTLSRMPCLENLAKSIKKMCPDLSNVLETLLADLHSFLESLESNKNSENREILQFRMSLAVNEFSVKACKILPNPTLLKILEAWQLSKQKGKYPKNPDLYKKVLTCLHEEVKSFEVTVIARALYDDEAFKRVLCSGVDSQDFSIFSSQPLEHSCSGSLQLSERIQLLDFSPRVRSQYLDNSLSFEPSQSRELPDSQQSLVPRYIPVDSSNPIGLADNIDKLGPLTKTEAFLYENPHPTPLFPSSQSRKRSSNDSLSPFKKSGPKRSYRTGSFSPLSSFQPLIVNVQPFEDEDSDSDSCYPTQKPVKLKSTKNNKKVFWVEDNQTSEGEDTSDCDKDPDIRFLTPTLFKKGQNYVPPNVVYLSDEGSCGSSIVTTFIDSQPKDPSFKPNYKLILDKPIKNKASKKVQKTPKEKPKSSKNQKATRQTTLKDFATRSKKTSPPNLNDSHADFQKNVGKKKKVKLFNQDAAAPPSRSSDGEASAFLIRKRKSTSKEIQSLGNKRHCAECKITFKTSNELKKHIFIFHTYDDLSD